MSDRQAVSLIATVKNERVSVDAWLCGVAGQSRLPDEVIVVDGGSTDGTLDVLQEWDPGFPVNISVLPGASISEGRNHAMNLAGGDIIAVTDCGTIAQHDWLERLIAPFQDSNVDVVSGFFVPARGTRWDRALAAATLPDAREINPEKFLPSSRSVALRSAWVRFGFAYPEWLDYCEDLILDLQLKHAGARFHFEPDAIVTFAVRPDPGAFWRQYYRYARGDGKAGLFSRRHLVRYATYLGLLSALVRGRPRELLLVAILGLLYMSKAVRRLVRRDREAGVGLTDTALTATLIPLQIAIGDVAKMAGYPVGVVWRYRRFGSLNPRKNWRRVSSDGRMWNPAAPLETPRRRAG